MAHITKVPLLRHLRSEPSRHILHFRRGRLVRSGRGVAYWFRPLSASIAEVPCDDRDLAFLFHGRTSDFQDVTVQGVIGGVATADSQEVLLPFDKLPGADVLLGPEMRSTGYLTLNFGEV